MQDCDEVLDNVLEPFTLKYMTCNVEQQKKLLPKVNNIHDVSFCVLQYIIFVPCM